MRNKYLIALLLILPAKLFAQSSETDITGLWKGTLYNDTTKQFYKYEIGISEEKGKLTGFSHTWFILEDKQYFGIKKVKVKRQDGKIIIEDAGLISNNYPVAPAKGVRQLNLLVLGATDSVMTLSGPFTTNSTKEYRPLTGTIRLERKNDYWQSALVPHLQELNLTDKLSFVKDDVLLARNNIIIAENKAAATAVKNTITAPVTKQVNIKAVPAPEKEIAIAKVETNVNKRNEEETPTVNKSDTVYQISSTVSLIKQVENKETSISAEEKVTALPKEKEATKAVAVTQPVVETKTNAVLVKENEEKEKQLVKSMPVVKPVSETKDIAASNVAAKDVEKRTTLLQQTVSFKSDSLQISLYDNGEVDGDTVSVLMNGNIIMAKQRLSTNAVRKTIFIPQNVDTVQLVMYAENLGTIAPNTGLLVVKDGKDLYEIRFSGDLQKNAAIIFRRKKE